MNELSELENKFIEISEDTESFLSNFIQNAISATFKTVITKGDIYNLRPYEIECAGLKKGKVVKKVPKNTKDINIYHFNLNDQIVMIYTYGQSTEIVNKEFCFYGLDFLERVYFTSTGRLRNISKAYYNAGVIVKHINWGRSGCQIYNYFYSGSCLEKVSVKQKEHTHSEFSQYEIHFNYNDGVLESIVNSFPNGYKEYRYP